MQGSPRPPLTPSRESRRLLMIQDVFRQQGPFLGSGGRYSPGPTTAAPLLATLRPLSNDLSLPWVSFRSSPAVCGEVESRLNLSLDALADGFIRRRSFRARPPFTRPCRSFWSAFAELIRGQTSPTDFCNCTIRRAGNQTRTLLDPRGDEGLDLLPFLTNHALSLAEAVIRGEPRSVRS